MDSRATHLNSFPRKGGRIQRAIKAIPQIRKLSTGGVLLIALLTMSSPAFSQKSETIEATARGTGSQMGQNIGIRLTIYDFSTQEDREVLAQAFAHGQNQGLVNALSKMRAVGHIAINGTLGYDVSFIRFDFYSHRAKDSIRHEPPDQFC